MDLKDLPNKHLLNMDVAVVGDVGGDTASAMHHFFDASPQVGLFVSALGCVRKRERWVTLRSAMRRSRCAAFCTHRKCIKRMAISTSSHRSLEKNITMPSGLRYLNLWHSTVGHSVDAHCCFRLSEFFCLNCVRVSRKQLYERAFLHYGSARSAPQIHASE